MTDPFVELELACWQGSFTEIACCDQSFGLGGNPACWDDIFTFEACCPKKPILIVEIPGDASLADSLNVESSESCWKGELSLEATCCDQSISLDGNPACWDNTRNFAACCPRKAVPLALTSSRDVEFASSPNMESCWKYGLSEQVCCSPSFGPQGLEQCWDDQFTFSRCCPEECWTTRHTTESLHICCDPSHGSQGANWCWHDVFTFDKCCNDYIAARCAIHISIRAAVYSVALLTFWLLLAARLGQVKDKDIDIGSSSQEVLGRLHGLDNAKFIFVAMVIGDHMGSFGRYQPYFHAFQTRGLCFISGFVRRKPFSRKVFTRLVTKILAPYLFWNSLGYFAYTGTFTFDCCNSLGEAIVYKFWHGYLWYLPGLMIWELASALLSLLLCSLHMKQNLKLPLIVLISLIGGYFDLGITKGGILCHLPFYVIGQHVPLHWWLHMVPMQTFTLSGGLALLAGFFVWENSASGSAFMLEIPLEGWGGPRLRSTAYHCGFTETHAFVLRVWFRMAYETTKLCIVIFFCTPRSKCVLSKFGQYTIYAYVLHDHPFFYSCADYLHTSISMAPRYFHLCGMLWPILLAAILCSPLVRSVFCIFLEPVWLPEVLKRFSSWITSRMQTKAKLWPSET